jgi:hypothetical protein
VTEKCSCSQSSIPRYWSCAVMVEPLNMTKAITLLRLPGLVRHALRANAHDSSSRIRSILYRVTHRDHGTLVVLWTCGLALEAVYLKRETCACVSPVERCSCYCEPGPSPLKTTSYCAIHSTHQRDSDQLTRCPDSRDLVQRSGPESCNDYMANARRRFTARR